MLETSLRPRQIIACIGSVECLLIRDLNRRELDRLDCEQTWGQNWLEYWQEKIPRLKGDMERLVAEREMIMKGSKWRARRLSTGISSLVW